MFLLAVTFRRLQQEPRLLAAYSKDETMVTSYKENKDLYANIATTVYHNNYEDNREFYSDGSFNMEGKQRRGNCKSLLLGLMYGRGVASIADQIKTHEGEVTREDIKQAQNITDQFFNGYPRVKEWIDKTESDAKVNGYVEDLWGRRRRLPDLLKPEYEVVSSGSTNMFNPLIGAAGAYNNELNELIHEYTDRAQKCHDRRSMEKLKYEAQAAGITIHENGGFIARAERQCVNARIQGGAATMSKRAMIAVFNDPLMKELDFKLLLAVHDELIGECPIENADKCCERLSELMIHAGEPECSVPMKCDTDSYKAWYLDVYSADVKNEFKKLLKEGVAEEVAFSQICREHEECTYDQLRSIVYD